ncbi:MAG TPA: ThiF family adenylyltransferase, partial [Chthoniobacterales bacterium]|nr:ThiF family adenylyltransferase [Chthoniobacterales bacterium]
MMISDDPVCLLRITEKDRVELERLVFKRYPDREWGTFFRFGYRITSWGVHATFVELIEPFGDGLDPTSGIVEFKAAYILRAQLSLSDTPLGIGVIHSHPEGGGTGASSLDNDMDDYFAREFLLYGGLRPYLSLRISRAPDQTFRFSGEAWHEGAVIPITEMLTVGCELSREYAESCSLPQENFARKSFEFTTRLASLIGYKVTRIQAATVGVIGCGGLGSPAIHILVRSGIRRFVLVDPDMFEPSNLERLHGSTRSDVGASAYKVDILRRLIMSIAPDADVRTLVGNVLDGSVLDEILRCDIVLGCTDTQHSRAALGDYATHYLLPCIDGAVLMRMKDGTLTEQVGEIARYTADDPCPWCMGRIDQRTLAYELMSDSERQGRAE